MLDIERIESGTMGVRLTDCDPRALIDQSIDSVRGLAGEHQIVARYGAHLALVRADADRIVQTLTNLIGNAIKFSPTGSTIDIFAENNRCFVDFAVADQGSGIRFSLPAVDDGSHPFDAYPDAVQTQRRPPSAPLEGSPVDVLTALKS